ncbi:sodium ion-translocating decarboxylase subunit beta [Peptoniphilus rhinitidis]|uniref:sodium ion-translocating decarboxylase subunit beta n=1 Tax=Peptoniphilus rhinitidis TaxID=1175452 RepID=UPI0011451DAF|nr:sodium ion-translocating decarboxylase subunit beta [Peptoniphilus rhinitidis]
MNKLIIITTISLLGVGNLYNSDGAASIGIIGGTDGSTEIYTEKKEDNDKNEGIEITSGTDGSTEIYTDKE